jgi:hypothetical protein
MMDLATSACNLNCGFESMEFTGRTVPGPFVTEGSAVMEADDPRLTWHTSRHARDRGSCVEVTVTTDTSRWPHKAGAGKLYLMRDSNRPDGPVLAFTPAEWEAFVLGVRDGEFDVTDGGLGNPPT